MLVEKFIPYFQYTFNLEFLAPTYKNPKVLAETFSSLETKSKFRPKHQERGQEALSIGNSILSTGLTLSGVGLEGFLYLVTFPSLFGPFNLYQSERNRAFNRFGLSTVLVKVK